MWLAVVVLAAASLRAAAADCCSCIMNGSLVRCDALGVQHVPAYVPDTTTELYFKRNDLRAVEGKEFQRFSHLRVLDLFSNAIARLEPDALTQSQDHVAVGNYTLHWSQEARELRIRYEGPPDARWKAMEPLCSQVSSLVRDSPGDWDSLEILYLGNNLIDSVPASFLAHLPNLKVFSLHSNKIRHLDKDTFRHNIKLLDLDLSMNQISSLLSETFAYLKSLKILSLESNSLTALDKYTFEFNSRLTVLNLAYNRIETLHPDTFRNAGSLKELYLNNNRLRSLHEHLFRNTKSLMMLYLVGNKLRELPAGVFADTPSLAWLTLRENLLTRLPRTIFANNHNLTYFDVRDNKLSSVHEETFSATPELRALDVGKNLLTSLDFQRPLPWLDTLQLDGNPWRCDCGLRPLVQMLQDLAAGVGPETPACHQPDACRGFDIRDVVSYDNLDFTGRADPCTTARKNFMRAC